MLSVRYSMTQLLSCTVKIQRIHPQAKVPNYANPGDAGADIYAVEAVTLEPLQRGAVATGLCVEVPVGYEIQIRPKSGLALNYGITVLNSPGTIDAGYRGEVKVILINLGSEPYSIQPGQKIAQMVIAPVVMGNFVETTSLSQTQRSTGGFGSTGLG
jgi:dUTP pyrophosphatase